MQEDEQILFILCWLHGMGWIILSRSCQSGFPRLQENIMGINLIKATEQILYRQSLFSIPSARQRIRGYRTDAEGGLQGQD